MPPQPLNPPLPARDQGFRQASRAQTSVARPWSSFGLGDFVMFGKIAGAGLLALAAISAITSAASAASAYDGRWSLTITTERGACDRSYNFPVEIVNGNVSF